MRNHNNNPAVQPEAAAALKGQGSAQAARFAQSLQVKTESGALARGSKKSKGQAEDDEAQGAQPADQGPDGLVVANADQALEHVDMGTYQLAQLVGAQMASGAGGVGAGVTGVGLAGAAGVNMVGSLGAAGLQTATWLSTSGRLALGAAGAVGAVTAANNRKGDDAAPTVTAAQSFSYPENSAVNASVGTVAAADNVGVTGFRFSVTQTSTSADGYFSIGANGAVTLTAAGAAAGVASNDFETGANSFTYGVQARDAAGNWSSSTNVTFNLTDGDDAAPTVTAAQSLSYPENSAVNASVGTVAAADNVGVTGFRFSATNTSTSADGYFSIGANGAVTLTAAGAAAGVASNDFETGANSFTYGVQARDAAGNWSSSTNVTFNLTDGDDAAPTVTAAQSFSYPENSAVNASVGTVAAADNVGVTGFRFSATNTSTSADGYFSIGANGAVTLTAAGAAAGVASNDFETGANSFTYGVQARDAAGNWSSSTNVTFNLTDGDDAAPTVTAAQSFSYPENSAVNASVGTVAAADNVGVTGFRFSATNTSTSADGYFSIGANGAVTLTAAGAAAGVASNDFETGANSFTYGVQARDAAGNWSSSTNVTFNLTDGDDAAPTVTAAQSFSYPENSAVNASVGTVAAADNVGVTGFRFSATNTSTSADGYFSIGANGAVTLTAAGAAAGVASNDFETGANSFTYGVQARDAAGNWSSSTNVTFNLTDGDDAAPTVTAAQSFSYPENSAVNASVGTVSAADNVGVTGFRFSATNTSTSADGYFSIGANGAVTLTAAGAAAGVASNDFETGANSFTYGVQARDAAGNWSSSSNVSFNLTDLNDTAPVEEWSDAYDDIAGFGNTGPLSFSGSPASAGVIEEAGDIDIFGFVQTNAGEDGAGREAATWWNGVYEIDVTGQLNAADLDLKLFYHQGSGQDELINSPATELIFSVSDDKITLSYDKNVAPGGFYHTQFGVFAPHGEYVLAVGANRSQTGSYSLSINFIDDYADAIIFENGQARPDNVVDTTADLGIGTILFGDSKEVQGLFNYQGDIDIWKYEGAGGEAVSVNLSAGASLEVWDHQGNRLQAIDGTYLLTGDTYLHVMHTSALVGSGYQLELLPGFFIA